VSMQGEALSCLLLLPASDRCIAWLQLLCHSCSLLIPLHPLIAFTVSTPAGLPLLRGQKPQSTSVTSRGSVCLQPSMLWSKPKKQPLQLPRP
jgi:hypothetical protein